MPDLSQGGDISGAEAVALVNAQKEAEQKKQLSDMPNRGKDDTVINSNPDAQKSTADLVSEAAKSALGKGPSTEEINDKLEEVEAPKQESRKYKLKVDGKEVEVDEDELKRGYSHQKAANKILQEGKAARKQAEQFVNMMKDKGQLFDAISKLGHDPRALAEEYLASQLEQEMMDPRDRELADARKKLQSIEDMERQQREAVQKRHDDEMRAKYAKDYNDKFVEALQESGLPGTKPMVAEMAKYIGRSAKIGFKMTPLEASQLVKEDIQRAQMSLYKDADGETLLRLLGDDMAAKLLQARGSKVKNPEAQLRTPSVQGEIKPRSKDPKKRMSAKEWRDFNRGK